MNCAWCGGENRDDARFCGDCGRGLRFDAACGHCGANNPAGARFCDACGTQTGESAAETDAVAPAPSPPAPRRLLPGEGAASGLLARVLTPQGLGLIVLLTAAVVLRVANLGSVPVNVTADEADNLQVVYHIMENTGPGFFELDWKPAPAFSTYVITGFMRVFGESVVGMRMASVVISVAAIGVFYALARQTMSLGASLSAAFLLATGLWFLHFSRSGWENVHVALFALMAVLLVTQAARRGSLLLFAATGVAAALGIYGYSGGRTIVLGVLAFLPVAMVLHPDLRRRNLVGFGVTLVVFLVLIAPQLKTALDDWDYFNRRSDAVSVLNHLDDYQGDTGLVPVLAHQAWRTVDGFFLMDSGLAAIGLNSRYISPGWAVLDRATGVLFWLGVVVSLWRWRETSAWWAMLLALIVPIQVLSTSTPDVARAVGAAPLFYLFAGLGLHWLTQLRVAKAWAARAAVAVAVLAIAFLNVSSYYRWMVEPGAAAARQPAVELAEFEVWQGLQMAAAERGDWGFNVGQWHQIRDGN